MFENEAVMYRDCEVAGISKYELNPSQLDKWMHQNGATVIDCREGCLQDNLLLETNRGYALLLEHAKGTWYSSLDLYFEAAREDKKSLLWDFWDEWSASYDAEMEAAEQAYR